MNFGGTSTGAWWSESKDEKSSETGGSRKRKWAAKGGSDARASFDNHADSPS